MKRLHYPSAFVLFLVYGMLIFSNSSCHYYNIEKRLGPDDAEFLTKVRYIITKKEERMFLDLPADEREQFKEEFWRRRDPDPTTEENEFKMEYFDRIERANELFRSEGRPGWLTDRGRIYILFGPPMDRITYPMGYSAASRCQEIWYYGTFPVVFFDATCTGNYRLVTYDLTAIRSLNLMYMHELTMAQAQSQQTIHGDSRFFDFSWDISKTLVETNQIEGVVLLDVSYAALWFKEKEGKLVTTLDLLLELHGDDGQVVWEYKDSYQVESSEEELKKEKKKKFHIEIPFVLEKEFPMVQLGKSKMYATLINRTGGDKIRKVLDFKL
ncbi:MAG: GWxTD domain-containing protein [Candidatus Aminicenantes bacterium]|nr:GWxTD domain-containing protein [Candidatus Aminicenantes bacterium]